MPKNRIEFFALSLVVILASLLVPTAISSTDSIRINSTGPSIPGQRVIPGGNVNLYFGNVTLSGVDWIALTIFEDTWDFNYSPKFPIANLTDASAISIYDLEASGRWNGGRWLVGNNWINGSIPYKIWSPPPHTHYIEVLGNYSIKAYSDNLPLIVATDTYFSVYPLPGDPSLQITPPIGPAGTQIQINGTGHPAFSSVTITLYNLGNRSWNYLASATAGSQGKFSVNSDLPDLKELSSDSYYGTGNRVMLLRSEVSGLAQSLGNFSQFTRELTKVGNYNRAVNGTSFAGRFNVQVGDNLDLWGRGFHPGNVTIKWDGLAVVNQATGDDWVNSFIIGNTVANSTGDFQTAITIPNANQGEHFIAIEDSAVRLIIKILLSYATLQITPPSGPSGTIVTFSGSGYPPLSNVKITYSSDVASWGFWKETTADSSGTINFSTVISNLITRAPEGMYSETSSWQIPFRAEVNGSYYTITYWAQYKKGLKTVGIFTIKDRIFGNGMSLNDTWIFVGGGTYLPGVRVKVGDTISISGKWFHLDTVNIKWIGGPAINPANQNQSPSDDQWLGAAILKSTTTDSNGSFSTTITIPPANLGTNFLAVEDDENKIVTRINVNESATVTPTPTAHPYNPTPTPSPTPKPTATSIPQPTASPTSTLTPTPTPTYTNQEKLANNRFRTLSIITAAILLVTTAAAIGLIIKLKQKLPKRTAITPQISNTI